MRKMILGLLLTMVAMPAAAATVYENLPVSGEFSCAYSTTCAETLNLGNVYAAQRFTLDRSTRITGGIVFDLGFGADETQPSTMNWMFLTAEGAGGLPGQQLSRGSSATANCYNDRGYLEIAFALPDVTLQAGSYYVAVQAISDSFETYLPRGEATSGGAETRNGGATWTANGSGYPSIALSLQGEPAAVVPETTTWAMMIVGFGLVGAAMRRRNALRTGVRYV